MLSNGTIQSFDFNFFKIFGMIFSEKNGLTASCITTLSGDSFLHSILDNWIKQELSYRI